MKLQNNYTTPEQSKRLLELGLPADSADFYIHISECVKYNFDEKHEEIYKKCEYGVIGGSGIFGSEIPALLHLSDGSPEYFPCWSVGRLIDIDMICDTKEHDTANGGALAVNYYAISDNCNIIDWCVNEILDRYNEGRYDFSKLDD